MPKMKSNRGARKRFSLTARGKVRRAHAYRRHKLAKKTGKRNATCVNPPWYPLPTAGVWNASFSFEFPSPH